MERGESLNPEAALFLEPKNEKPDQAGSGDAGEVEDPVRDYFVSKGVPWNEMSEEAQENLIRVALAHRFTRYVELRELEEEEDLSANEEEELAVIVSELGPLASIAEKQYSRMSGANDLPVEVPTDESEENAPEDSSVDIPKMAQNDLHPQGGNYTSRQGGWGEDSPTAMAFRARMSRCRDCLRENGFAAFAAHLEAYLSSTSGAWSYHPPSGVEWTIS